MTGQWRRRWRQVEHAIDNPLRWASNSPPNCSWHFPHIMLHGVILMQYQELSPDGTRTPFNLQMQRKICLPDLTRVFPSPFLFLLCKLQADKTRNNDILISMHDSRRYWMVRFSVGMQKCGGVLNHQFSLHFALWNMSILLEVVDSWLLSRDVAGCPWYTSYLEST